MASPNFPHQGYENYWSIETIKSLIENPGQIPKLSFTLQNVPIDNSPDYDYTLKLLQEIYNPPEDSLHLSHQRLQELHYMRPKERRVNGLFQKDIPRKLDAPWDNGQEPLSMVRVLNRNSRPAPSKVFNRNMPGIIDPFNSNKRQLPFPYPGYGQYQVRPPEKPQKGKMDINVSYFDLNPKKKVHSIKETNGKNLPQNVNVIDLDDDDEVTALQPEKKNKVEKKLIPKHLGRTGQNKTKSLKMIEISDSPEITEIVKKDEVAVRLEERAIIEEEKDGDKETTTNATNFTNPDDLNDNEKEIAHGNLKADEETDFFSFDVEDLGIKILGEVFLCDKCQKQIPQKDVDKGLKETCAVCLRAKNSKVAWNKKNHAPIMKEEHVRVEPSHVPISSSLETENQPQDNYNIMTPLFQGRFYYEESARTNILDPLQNKKSVSIGKNHQASVLPLALYDSNKRITRKLWKPDRIDLTIYEKFKDEVNDKNSVYLLDEEITEILVRHRYNVEQALLWCVKSNPEFQYYVKRSSNRKRIITRNWEKILENY